MSKWKSVFLFAIGVAVLTVCVAVHSQQPASKPATKPGSSDVHSIVLPRYSADIPQGPNLEVYVRECLICHTSRYVAMQPGFPKAVWQAEVKKMVDAYGAPITDADQVLIVEYLVVIKGVEAPASAPAPPK